jgi:hypothetical protein
MEAKEILAELENFTGTEQYHRLTIMRNLVATDGVAWLTKNANCYWLTDIIASYQPSIRKYAMVRPNVSPLLEMQVWKLTKNKTTKGAKIICTDGNSEVPVYSQRIPYTDFPLDEITIWVEAGDQCMVMLLPTEH